MNAEEMFKELGYKLTKNNESKIEYTITSTFKAFVDTVVSFDICERLYYVSSLGSATLISPNIHKAITKQMEELGWLDD